jgi:hypothetical protein
MKLCKYICINARLADCTSLARNFASFFIFPSVNTSIMIFAPRRKAYTTGACFGVIGVIGARFRVTNGTSP